MQREAVRIETRDAPLQQPEGRLTWPPGERNLVHHVEAVARESPGRLDKVAAIKAESCDLLARQHVDVLEPDAFCQAEQSGVDYHLGEVGLDHAIGALVTALIGGRDDGGVRLTAAKTENDLGRVDAEHRIRSDLVDGGAGKEIGASRRADRPAREEIAVELAARLLELHADVAVLRLKAAFAHQGATYPGSCGSGMEHVAHHNRLVEVAARRGKIDRQVAITVAIEKSLEARGRAGHNLPFRLDPAIATAPAGIKRALDHIEGHWLVPRRRGWPAMRGGRRCCPTGQHTGQNQSSDQASTHSHVREGNQSEKVGTGKRRKLTSPQREVHASRNRWVRNGESRTFCRFTRRMALD